MAANRYQHTVPPDDYKQLLEYIERELAGVSSAVDSIEDGQRDVLSAPPARVFHGMVVYADGTNWNPDGSGREGQYAYTSGNVWVYQLGSGSEFSGSLIPDTTSVYDIGSSSKTWQHVHAEGIQFPSVQVASANANNLDDYEEGSWTPTLTFATPGDLSVVYNIQSGFYTKIGRCIYASFNIVTSSFLHTTASGALRVSGLPFTGNGSLRGCGRYGGYTDANRPTVVTEVPGANTFTQFVASGSGVGQNSISVGQMPTGGTVDFRFNIFYLS